MRIHRLVQWLLPRARSVITTADTRQPPTAGLVELVSAFQWVDLSEEACGTTIAG